MPVTTTNDARKTYRLQMRMEKVHGNYVALCVEEQEMPHHLSEYMSQKEFTTQIKDINTAIMDIAEPATRGIRNVKRGIIGAFATFIPTFGFSNLVAVPGLIIYSFSLASQYQKLASQFVSFVHSVHSAERWQSQGIRWHIGEFPSQIAITTNYNECEACLRIAPSFDVHFGEGMRSTGAAYVGSHTSSSFASTQRNSMTPHGHRHGLHLGHHQSAIHHGVHGGFHGCNGSAGIHHL